MAQCREIFPVIQLGALTQRERPELKFPAPAPHRRTVKTHFKKDKIAGANTYHLSLRNVKRMAVVKLPGVSKETQDGYDDGKFVGQPFGRKGFAGRRGQIQETGRWVFPVE